jgi:hypothetical protein
LEWSFLHILNLDVVQWPRQIDIDCEISRNVGTIDGLEPTDADLQVNWIRLRANDFGDHGYSVSFYLKTCKNAQPEAKI